MYTINKYNNLNVNLMGITSLVKNTQKQIVRFYINSVVNNLPDQSLKGEMPYFNQAVEIYDIHIHC